MFTEQLNTIPLSLAENFVCRDSWLLPRTKRHFYVETLPRDLQFLANQPHKDFGDLVFDIGNFSRQLGRPAAAPKQSVHHREQKHRINLQQRCFRLRTNFQ